MQSYAKFVTEDWRIVVLVDQDKNDCQVLKKSYVMLAVL
jgi:hypothetical protein